eukprot:6208433-Pleurochrysis_carterae.AAC.7
MAQVEKERGSHAVVRTSGVRARASGGEDESCSRAESSSLCMAVIAMRAESSSRCVAASTSLRSASKLALAVVCSELR